MGRQSKREIEINEYRKGEREKNEERRRHWRIKSWRLRDEGHSTPWEGGRKEGKEKWNKKDKTRSAKYRKEKEIIELVDKKKGLKGRNKREGAGRRINRGKGT